MDMTSEVKPKEYICAGLLAHVDAGKTTLSEALLYQSGMIRRAGRVDKKDTFLDTDRLERARGITIFSKQAVLNVSDTRIVTLLDTPGHVDFSSEMERTLQVLDYAVLVISGADGVQGHTRTLWRLLARYRIPVFLFVNKMDQSGADKEIRMRELKSILDENCVDFSDTASEEFYENVAVCDEDALEQYLEEGSIRKEALCRLIWERKLFPCYFGSALNMEGVEAFLHGFNTYTCSGRRLDEFGAKVFKIARDAQGVRLTYVKITGGSVRVRQALCGRDMRRNAGAGDAWEEKVTQIRIYSGEKYEAVEEAPAGCVCALAGLSRTWPGEGLGTEERSAPPLLEPVLTYQVILPENIDTASALPKFRQLEEEDPQLRVVWNEPTKEIQVQLMGEVQLGILKSLILERFGMEVEFGSGAIVYKETIRSTVEGVGHFEPLRHYAEVHLLLEPLEAGSGLVFASVCSEDILDKNWQRLILSSLSEREYPGVLAGASVTDMKITLVSGRAHLKHTQGGDFRQAACRALRQGLMQAESVLLEPYYKFWLNVPQSMAGRALADIERMHGSVDIDSVSGDGRTDGIFSDGKAGGLSAQESGMRIFSGTAPVAAMCNYQKEVVSYTRGEGSLFCAPEGYRPCHNAEEVIAKTGYDPGRDTENPAGSVFCAHGAGFPVSWDKVWQYMHLESWLASSEYLGEENGFLPEIRRNAGNGGRSGEETWIGTEEIDRILDRTYNANKREKGPADRKGWRRHGKAENTVPAVTRTYRPGPAEEEYLLVDGYNIIFAWDELKSLAAENIDGARGKLLDILCNYQGIRGCHLIVVFDAYRVQGHRTEVFDYQNIHVVYTKEAETADAYIEKFAHENAHRYRVTVATSDGLEQVIIRGAGCSLLSAKDLREEVVRKNRYAQEQFGRERETGRSYLLDGISEEILKECGLKEDDRI